MNDQPAGGGPAVRRGRDPKVSVILIAYNHEAYIGQALESVLGQRSDFPFEIVITEDCSTDATGSLVEAAASANPRTINLIRSRTNLCTNEVVSRAIAAAKGEYVAFLDGDDYWTSQEKLQKQARFLDENPDVALCFHDAAAIDQAGRIMEPSLVRAWGVPERSGYAEIVGSNFIPGPSPMIRRAAIAALPPWFDEAEFGDLPLYLRAAEEGSLACLPEVLAAYRIHPDGYWTGLDDVEKLRRTLRFLQRVKQDAAATRRPAVDAAMARTGSQLVLALLHARRWAAAAAILADFLRGTYGNARLAFIRRVAGTGARRAARAALPLSRGRRA